MIADVIQERVRFDGPSGRLAGELAYPTGATRLACLLVNPHPHMGGRMDNNVIRHLATALCDPGAVTLRFDYAGVGESDADADRPVDVARSMSAFWETGHAPEDAGWADDARSALEWLETQVRLPVVVVGYSFGAYVVTGLLDHDVPAMILISPTLAHHDLSAVSTMACPKLVIYSDNDFATSAEQTERWIDGLCEPKLAVRMPSVEHFFRGVEDDLARSIVEFLARWLVPEEATA